MSIFSVLSQIAKLLPIIHDLVEKIETLYPQSGRGAEKLAMLKSMLEASAATLNIGQSAIDTLWPVVSATVAEIVKYKKG